MKCRVTEIADRYEAENIVTKKPARTRKVVTLSLEVGAGETSDFVFDPQSDADLKIGRQYEVSFEFRELTEVPATGR
jgi:hypothetical protein